MSVLSQMAADIALPFVDWAEPNATYTASGGSPVPIQVIFTNPGESLEIVKGTKLVTATPAAFCKPADIPNVDTNDTLVIDGVTWYVVTPNKPTNGLQKLDLSLEPQHG